MNEKYFHISKNFLGNIAEFIPRVPECAKINEEGDIPRICVSSSVKNCMYSIASRKDAIIADFIHEISKSNMDNFVLENPALYYTDKKPFLPPNASDFRENDERWYVNNTEFNFAGYIDLLSLINNKEIVLIDSRNKIEIDKEKYYKLIDNALQSLMVIEEII